MFHVEHDCAVKILVRMEATHEIRVCSTWNLLCPCHAMPNQEKSLQGAGNRNWILPQPAAYSFDLVDIASSNPENNLTGRDALGVCPAEKFIELAQCP
jgi:hypothetical protein